MVQDKNIFHSGDLHFWHWEDDTPEEEKAMYDAYMVQLEKIKKLDRIDIAFVPVDPRLGVNTLEGVELFYKILIKIQEQNSIKLSHIKKC